MTTKHTRPAAAACLIAAAAALVLGLLVYPLLPWLGLERLASYWALLVGLVLGALLGAGVSARRGPPRAAEAPAAEEPVKTVYVGNLAYRASSEELRDLFARYGHVHSVRLMTDRATHRPRGFGFVEMDAKAADAAIAGLDGAEFCGRQLRVSEGRQREQRAGS